MDLRDILKVLHRNWIPILTSTLLGVLVAGGVSLLSSPTYTATTRLFVAIQNTGTVSELQQGNSFSQARVQSYVETASTPVVLQPVIDDLGLDMSPYTLAKQVSASADLNTVLITLSANSDSPVQAAAIAQAMATSLVTAVTNLESSEQTQGASPVKLSIVTPATAPESPSAPNTRLNLGVGFMLGILGGIVLAFLRLTLDSRIRGIDDIERITSIPMLGGIAFDSEATKKPLLTDAGLQSPRAESFRQIRTNLHFANVSSNAKAVLISSSLPGEGKSTTATNMAIAMAQAGQRVVLVDADLRRPMVSEYLGLEGSAGLTTVLVGDASIDDVLQPWGSDYLSVLTSGQIPPNPSELLGSDAMTHLISHLEDRFDAVIIDAPPLIPVTDATILAQKVGGVVLVVGAGTIKAQALEKSLAALKLVEANLLGVVANLLPVKGPDSYAYSYYRYDAKAEVRGNARTASQSRSNTHSGAARHSHHDEGTGASVSEMR